MVDDIRPQEKQTKSTEPPVDKKIQAEDPIQLEAPHSYKEQRHKLVDAPDQRPPQKSGGIIERVQHFLNSLSKKQKIVFALIALVLLVSISGGVYALTKKDPQPTTPAPVVTKSEPAPTPKPTTEPSRLTGVQIDPELNKRPVTSIQIENSPDARPQSGLKDAGVIFEAVAEGGITRFNASFLEAQPDYIGPIRSVRPYYAILAAPFDPIFVHAGGSADGLATLRNLGLKDLDHGANGNAFQRVSSRYAPHNLYSSTAALDQAARGRGYNTSNVKGFERKDEQKGQPITAKTINMTLSSALYNLTYTYDPATNTYPRIMGGKPHTDERSGAQLAPKTVVALVMNYSQNGIYSVYKTTGSGTALIFQDGTVTQGSWQKTADKEQLTFTASDGKILKLNAGQTWFTLVKDAGAVTYTP